eukprot:5534310-Alexandrium_andersonii.AAC.1
MAQATPPWPICHEVSLAASAMAQSGPFAALLPAGAKMLPRSESEPQEVVLQGALPGRAPSPMEHRILRGGWERG